MKAAGKRVLQYVFIEKNPIVQVHLTLIILIWFTNTSHRSYIYLSWPPGTMLCIMKCKISYRIDLSAITICLRDRISLLDAFDVMHVYFRLSFTIVYLACFLSFLHLSFCSDPGIITTHTIKSFHKYPFHPVLFPKDKYCKTCKIPKYRDCQINRS